MLSVQIFGEVDEVQEFLGMDCWPVYDDEPEEDEGDEDEGGDEVEDSQPVTLPHPAKEEEAEVGPRLLFPFAAFSRFRKDDFEAADKALDLGGLAVKMRAESVPWALIIAAIVQIVTAWLASRQKKPA